MRADLHTHSNASDGTEPPAEVIARAAAAGLDVVALTDHDTLAGHAAAAAALPRGLTLVPGAEISTLLDGRSVHLLGYLFDAGDPDLAGALARLRDDRVQRARAMVDRLASLGVAVTWPQVTAIAGTAAIGRPHIARAMVEAGAIAEPADAFTPEWIADGGRAYVEKFALEAADAVALVRRAGGVPVLAHPRVGAEYYVSDEDIARLAAVGLAGAEVFHPDQEPAERSALRALLTDLGLAATGGSDDHGTLTGHRIGAEVAGPGAYEALLAQATGAAPITRA